MDKNKKEARESLDLISNPSFKRSFGSQAPPMTDITEISSFTETIYPTYQLDNSPIEFNIRSSTTHWTFLDTLRLYLKLKIVGADKQVVGATSKTGFDTLLSQIIFRNAEIYLDNVLVSNSNTEYAHCSYLQRLLFSSATDLTTTVANEGFVRNDTKDFYSDLNSLVTTTRALSKKEHIEFVTVPNSGLFRSGIVLPPNTQLRIRLFPQTNNLFYLFGEDPAANQSFTDHAVIDEAYVTVKRGLIHSKVENIIDATVKKKGTYDYYYKEADVRTFNLTPGNSVFQSESILYRQPAYFCIGILETDSYIGTNKTSPFVFRHHGLKTCQLIGNGETLDPNAILMNFDDKIYKRAYSRLCDSMKITAGEVTISEDDFVDNGYTIHVLHCDNSVGQADRASPGYQMPIKLKLEFKNKLDKNLTVVCFFVYDRCLKISKSGEVFITDN